MYSVDSADFARIEQAIEYLSTHFTEQPKLEDLAAKVHLSPSHFQKLFTRWAGISPKQFTQFLSLQYAKSRLIDRDSVQTASLSAGYSSSSRLHDVFVKLEGMTPGEYKNGGENLTLTYSTQESPFGSVFIASSHKGLCKLILQKIEGQGLAELEVELPRAKLIHQPCPAHKRAAQIFSLDWQNMGEITLHLRASDFQIKVWQALLSIPLGQLSTYSDIAQVLNKPQAARAVGNAVGKNPVAFIIPCHRVIQRSGHLGGYRWGQDTKSAILGWEFARTLDAQNR